jgi:hypothetical protein
VPTEVVLRLDQGDALNEMRRGFREEDGKVTKGASTPSLSWHARSGILHTLSFLYPNDLTTVM